MENNPHKILGVSQRASVKDIKTAYKRRLKRLRDEYEDGEENEDFRSRAAEYANAKDELLRAIKRNEETKGLSEEAYAKQKRQNRIFVVVVIAIIAAIASIPVLSVTGVVSYGPSINNGAVVAKIGDTEIKQGLVDGLTAYIEYANYGQRLDALEPDALEVRKNQTLVSVIVPAEMIRKHLETAGTGKLDSEAKTTVKEGVQAAYADANTSRVLRDQAVPKKAVTYFYELQEYYKIFQKEVLEKNPVTDEDAQAYYDEIEQYYNTPEQKSASHILIADPDHTPEKLAEAQDILAKAKAGDDFAELAKAYSNDESNASSGGDLGYFAEENDFVPEFSSAAWALQNEGDISDVVETEFGYHIIKLTGLREAASTSFDELKDSIITSLESERTGQAADDLKNEITVEYFVYVDPATGAPPISESALEANAAAAAAEQEAAAEEGGTADAVSGSDTAAGGEGEIAETPETPAGGEGETTETEEAPAGDEEIPATNEGSANDAE